MRRERGGEEEEEEEGGERTVTGESKDYEREEGLDGAERYEYYVEHDCMLGLMC